MKNELTTAIRKQATKKNLTKPLVQQTLFCEAHVKQRRIKQAPSPLTDNKPASQTINQTYKLTVFQPANSSTKQPSAEEMTAPGSHTLGFDGVWPLTVHNIFVISVPEYTVK